MSSTSAARFTKNFRQLNTSAPAAVFPLLCPVRESDWIDGWEYEMVFSKTGLIEKGCVFNTPGQNNKTTTWYTTTHDTENYVVEFVRITPGEMVVNISIRLEDNNDGTTTSDITYEYTPLNEAMKRWAQESLDETFKQTMSYWQQAINHYMRTGKKLPKNK